MKKVDLILKAIKHPLRAVRYAIHWCDMELRISEYAKASNKGERLVIRDWESARNGSDLYTHAHIRRYEWVLPLVKNVKVLLDDGCGSGYGTHYLATHGVESAVGIDISKDAIQFAQRHYQAENLLFKEMNACELQLDSGSFDAIVSFDVLEHIPFELKEKFVSETARVLKSGGTLYIGCPNGALARGRNPFHYELNEEQFSKLLSQHYGDIRLLGHDIVINGVRQGRNRPQHLGKLRWEFVIVEQDCASAPALLAICRNPVVR